MALPPGTHIGAYEVVARIGAGGMGEVYRARDTTLGRDVALKVLPDAVANDPERLARFGREARTLAALNPPHIAQIHGFETSGAVPALIMELVEGVTLAERLENGALPPKEAGAIALQIADALGAAHDQGIVQTRPEARQRQGPARRHRQGAGLRTGQGSRAGRRLPRRVAVADDNVAGHADEYRGRGGSSSYDKARSIPSRSTSTAQPPRAMSSLSSDRCSRTQRGSILARFTP
jgi:hypothetical protein